MPSHLNIEESRRPACAVVYKA